jgi:hypothetical protein
MESVAQAIRRRDWFLRRRDLLALGYRDADIRAALARKEIFRVRHGWFSVPDAPAKAILAVRTGGRLTGFAALESYGLRVPIREVVDVVVKPTACRLRSPIDKRRRLKKGEGVRVHWNADEYYVSRWRVSLEDALLHILKTETREIAIACASAIMRYKRWSKRRMAAVFRRAFQRSKPWEDLVSDKDDSQGETETRLRYLDAGLEVVSQPSVEGAGRFDFRVGPNSYVEVDGAQHDPLWTGEGESSWDHDFTRVTVAAISGKRTLRFNYRMLNRHWDQCLAATLRMVDDDIELEERRKARPAVPRAAAAALVARRRRARASPRKRQPASRV